MKNSCRKLTVAGMLGMALLASAMPLKLDFRLVSISVHGLSVAAKDGNSGGGNGNGGGSGGGSGSSSGNSGSDSGKGNSGNSSSSSGKGSSTSAGVDGAGSPATSSRSADNDDVTRSETSLNVHHSNGFTESVSKGNYVMKDAKGRVVVDRQARAEDVKRLKALGR